MTTLTPFHIAVQVRDLDEARRFYKGALGCAEGRSSDALGRLQPLRSPVRVFT